MTFIDKYRLLTRRRGRIVPAAGNNRLRTALLPARR